MFKFGIKNLRRLQNIEPIELKPITILVGRNSSGKSTFLRSFPLIRQSLMTRISSPVLWYGDLVDFGSYLTSVSDNKDTTNISFVFFSENMISETGRFWPHRSSRDADTPLSRYKNMTYEVALGLFEKRTVAKHIKRCRRNKC